MFAFSHLPKGSRGLLVAALYLTSLSVLSAQELNHTDEQGRRHGLWEQKYDNGKVRFTGTFLHGEPVDTFKHYFEQGTLKAIQIFHHPQEAYTRMYGDGEKLAAEGWHREQRKDSVWTYYDIEGHVVLREPFEMGKRNGLVVSYYDSGEVAETIEYRDDQRQGLWVQRFDNGRKRKKGQYEEDKLSGEVLHYRRDGSVKIKGNYKNGLMHGNWYFFDNQMKVTKKQVWKRGFPVQSSDPAEQEQIDKGNRTLVMPIEKEENIENSSWIKRRG